LETLVANFIKKHNSCSLPELALLLSKKPELPKEFIINQINGSQKAKAKLPFLLNFPDFIFPSPIRFSQASSSKTGKYKSHLLNFNTVLDLSGGMGIDSYFFSQQAKQVDYVELNENLVETVNENIKTLKAFNITCHAAKAEEFIVQTKKQFDLIYIDPDRRSAKEKAFKIEDCEPNVAELMPHIWKKTEHCLIKLSPMLDIKQALTQLPFCKEVHVVSVHNDCKELLFLLKKDFTGQPTIHCVNLVKNESEKFDFNFEQEQHEQNSIREVGKFLYEPNASILKAGAFKSIGAQLHLNKIATNTHLYTSSELLGTFPGRKLKVIQVAKPQKGLIQRANVVCRNFNMKPELLKKKYKIKDGGNQFLYAFSLEDGKKVFVLAELA
jgi:hypothetical protein